MCPVSLPTTPGTFIRLFLVGGDRSPRTTGRHPPVTGTSRTGQNGGHGGSSDRGTSFTNSHSNNFSFVSYTRDGVDRTN